MPKAASPYFFGFIQIETNPSLYGEQKKKKKRDLVFNYANIIYVGVYS
jgi:hypothetical protein